LKAEIVFPCGGELVIRFPPDQLKSEKLAMTFTTAELLTTSTNTTEYYMAKKAYNPAVKILENT